jgi:hypothetical protein
MRSLIQNEPGPRRVFWIRYNAAGRESARKEDPNDTFDPRIRPWYSGALAATVSSGVAHHEITPRVAVKSATCGICLSAPMANFSIAVRRASAAC